MSTALVTLTQKLATKLEMGDGSGLVETLKATAFKGQVSDAQMTALMVVANQYGLNPWTKEIYAFPDKNNGIVPVVGVDGWSRIINDHPAFDGMDFEQNGESCTCIIYRKDRSRPIRVTEWMDECRRGTGPWNSHPKRMLRHKTMIQAARIAFGYGGIYDQDEAERIAESGVRHMGEAVVVEPQPVNFYDQEKFDSNRPKWVDLIESGKKTPSEIISFAESRKEPFTEEQKAVLLSTKTQAQAVVEARQQDAPTFTYAQVADRLRAAQSLDELDEAATLIGEVGNAGHRAELTALYEQINIER